MAQTGYMLARYGRPERLIIEVLMFDNLCFSLTFETPHEQSSGRLFDIIVVTRRRACQNWSLRSGAERFLPDLNFFLCAIRREIQIKPGEHPD